MLLSHCSNIGPGSIGKHISVFAISKVSLDKLPSWAGILPLNRLLSRFKTVSSDRFPSSVGIVPLRLLPDKSNFSTLSTDALTLSQLSSGSSVSQLSLSDQSGLPVVQKSLIGTFLSVVSWGSEFGHVYACITSAKTKTMAKQRKAHLREKRKKTLLALRCPPPRILDKNKEERNGPEFYNFLRGSFLIDHWTNSSISPLYRCLCSLSLQGDSN